VLTRHYGASLAETPGTGAAGGMGEAVLRLLGGTLRPGIELLLDAAGFDDLLQGADLVLTGEGRIDRQSAHGKVPMGVGLRCKRAGVPCLALCGSVGPGAEAVYDCGITAIFSAVQGAASFEEIRKTAAGDMAFLTDSVLRMLCHFPTKGI
jgi:glycerate kinase